ncbi:MAG: hypothetical protein ACPG4Y_10625, partial [Chitinophagales bacterium]
MKKILLSLLTIVGFSFIANSQQLELAADINLDGFSSFQFSSEPQEFTEFDGKLYFSAKGTQTGTELFSYDGTDVELVADLFPGMVGLNFNNSDPYHLTVFDSKLYFVATNDGDSAYIFSYDGLSAPVVEVDLGISSNNAFQTKLIEFNSKLLYPAFDDDNTSYDLWEYDGTNTPSIVYSSATSVSYSYKLFFELDNNLYFYKAAPGNGLKFFVYDGTNPPSPAPNFNNYAVQLEESIIYNSKIYFTLYENSGTTGYEMWSYDGINAPTLVSDINLGTGSSSPSDFEIFNNELYFRADNGTDGFELWSYDGTSVTQAPSINAMGASDPNYLTVSNNKLYYTATDGTTGYELYEYDGTTATLTQEVIVGAAGGEIQFLTTFQGDIYFSANDGTVAKELYQYDGTDISLVANIFEGTNGSNPSYMTEFKNKIYFSAFGDKGAELYSFDGSTATLVIDVNPSINFQGTPNSSQPQSLIVYNDLLFFKAYNGTTTDCWEYDGVNSPTINSAIPADATDFIVFDGVLYFRSYTDGAVGSELWQYDGSAVSMVYDINPGANNSSPGSFYIFNDKLLFKADDGTNGVELWQYDGTNTPTIAGDIKTGQEGSFPSNFKEFDGKLYFSASADTIVGNELWVYDGVNPPTLELDLLPGLNANGYGYNSYISSINILNDKLVFTAVDTLNDRDIWEYDLVNPATKIVDYPQVTTSNQFASMQVIDGELYYWADESTGLGYELYKYDGTNAPVMFDELNVGGNTMPQTPRNFLKFDGDIYVPANDGIIG